MLDETGLQPSIVKCCLTWGFAPGWYKAGPLALRRRGGTEKMRSDIYIYTLPFWVAVMPRWANIGYPFRAQDGQTRKCDASLTFTFTAQLTRTGRKGQNGGKANPVIAIPRYGLGSIIRRLSP